MRLQGCFVHRTEIKRVVDYLKRTYEPNYHPRFKEDRQPTQESHKEETYSVDKEESLYKDIRVWTIHQDYVSISRIQRECSVGFNRASRYFLRLQEEGLIDKEPTKKGYRVLSVKEK